MAKSKVWLKIVIWIIVILLVLLLVATVALRIIFTKDKIISMILPRIEANLNRKVEIEDASLSIWGGLSLDIKGVKIYNLPEFSQEYLAQVETISLKVKLLPLLKKRIELTKGVLVKPMIVIEKKVLIEESKKQTFGRGVSNWDDLIKGGPALALPIIFGQIEVRDGSLLYTVPSENKEIVLSGINQRIKFSLNKENKGKADGEISISDIQTNLPNYRRKFPALPLSLKHNLNIDLDEDKLKIEKLELSLGDIKIDIKGETEKIRTMPFLDLKISSKDILLEKALSYLPSAQEKFLSELEVVGQAELALNLKGQPKMIPPPQVDGKLSFKKVKIDYAKVPFPLEVPYAEVLLNPRNLSFSTSDANFAGVPFSIRGVVDNFLSPNFNFEVKSDFDSKVLQGFEQFPKDMKLEGKVKFNLRAYGKLKNPKGAKISGSANFKKVNLENPNLTVPIKNLDANLVLRDYDLSIEELKCNLGKSDLDFKGRVANFVPRFLFPEEYRQKLQLDFVLNSKLLNIDEILSPADTIDTTKVIREKDISKKPPIALPDMDAQGKLFADKIIYKKVEFADFRADVFFFNKILKVENISSKVYQGEVDGIANYDLADFGNPKFDIVFNAKQVQANELANNFLTAPLFSFFSDRIYGKMDMTSHFKGEGSDINDIRKSLWAEGNGTLSDGRIEYGEFLSKLSKSLGLGIPQEDDIKTLTNSFRVKNQRVYFDDYQLKGTELDWDITGSVGFDETLDYLVTLSIPMEVARQYVDSGDLLKMFEGKKGKVVLPIKVGGTYSSPKFSLDTSKAQKKLKNDIEDKLKEEGKGLLDKLFGR